MSLLILSVSALLVVILISIDDLEDLFSLYTLCKWCHHARCSQFSEPVRTGPRQYQRWKALSDPLCILYKAAILDWGKNRERNSIDQGLLIKCIRADDKIYFCRIPYSYLFDLVKSAEFSDILSVILQTATSQVLHHCPYNRYRYVEADDFFHKYFTIRWKSIGGCLTLCLLMAIIVVCW